jgi:hypothetical protein
VVADPPLRDIGQFIPSPRADWQAGRLDPPQQGCHVEHVAHLAARLVVHLAVIKAERGFAVVEVEVEQRAVPVEVPGEAADAGHVRFHPGQPDDAFARALLAPKGMRRGVTFCAAARSHQNSPFMQGDNNMQAIHATTAPATAGLGRIIAAGAVGLVIWEAFARLVAPAWIGFPLDPTALIEMAVGLTGIAALALHIVTGLVFFPLGYAVAARPLAARLMPALPWPVLGAAYGVGLWVFAMYAMASLLGGAPPFLGFEPVAWASLVGHVALGIGIAGTLALLPGDAS